MSQKSMLLKILIMLIIIAGIGYLLNEVRFQLRPFFYIPDLYLIVLCVFIFITLLSKIG